MATLYVDYQNGNDSNDGTSFANRKKTLSSATSAASAGDTIRVMASPSPTLIGSGSIVASTAHGARHFIASVTYSTTPNQTQIVCSIDHGFSTDDTVCITANTNGYNLDGVYEITVTNSNTFTLNGYTASVDLMAFSGTGYVINWSSKRIWLDSAVTQTIASTGSRTSSWTASANVTCTLLSDTSITGTNMYWCEHAYSDQIAINATFTTGKAAYYTLPSTLDLSGYQQLSFYIRQSSGSVSTTGNYSLRLCTDTTGNTSVHTFTVPMGGPSGGASVYWRPVTIDLGTNLNSSIRSIALYVDSDLGAQTILLNNIIACKASSSADSLTLNSLIGLNTSSNKEWYPIESIVGQRVLINSTSYNRNLSDITYSCYGAYFTSTSGTHSFSFYKRECILTSIDNPATSSTTSVQIISSSAATAENPITISGGWDRTNMSTQSSDNISFFDGSSMLGYGLNAVSSYFNFENLGFVRYGYGINLSAAVGTMAGASLKNIHVSSNSTYNAYIRSTGIKDLNIISTSHRSSSSSQGSVHLQSCITDTGGGYDRNMSIMGSSGGAGLYLSSCSYCTIGNINASHIRFNVLVFSFSNKNILGNIYYPFGIAFSSGTTAQGCTFSSASYNNVGITTINNCTYGIYSTSANSYQNKFDIFDFFSEDYYNLNAALYSTYHVNGSSTIISGGTQDYPHVVSTSSNLFLSDCEINSDGSEYYIYGGGTGVNDTRIYSRNHDGVSGNHLNVFPCGTLSSNTSIRHTSSGYSWKADINAIDTSSTSYGPDSYPRWLVSQVAVRANSQLTVGVYIYRTGTGINGGIKIPKNVIYGINADVTSYASGSSGSWELVTATVTPTEDGVIPIYFETYYVSNLSHSLYFDDMSISQA